METQTVFFLGKPGSGKGTQAKKLAEKTGWGVYASGDLFRAIAKEDSLLGRKMKEENDAGLLAPPWFATYLFLKSLFSIPEGAGAIFDGFNRKVPEAELIVESLRWVGRPFTVLNIQVSDKSVLERIALRKGVEGRADDSAAEKRLQEYNKHTAPVLEIFHKAGVLIEIDGEPSPDEIAAQVLKALDIK